MQGSTPSIDQRLNIPVNNDRQRDRLLHEELRVSLPAIVQKFNPGPPATVNVLIATKEYVQASDPSANTLVLKTQAMTLPVLLDVPISMPGGGGYSLTFPIQVGDECLIVFADTPIDFWLQNGVQNNTPVAPINLQRHELGHGIAVFGLRSKPRGLSNYSTSSAQLRSDDGSIEIDLAEAGVTITAPKLTVNCTDEFSVTAPTIKLEGTTLIEINSSGNTTIDGHGFDAHAHVAPAGGGLTSGVA